MSSALVWFRRDLRVDDHAALHQALTRFERVWCVFVFDADILGSLPAPAQRRASLMHAATVELHERLTGLGSGLIVREGRPAEEIVSLARTLGVTEVLTAIPSGCGRIGPPPAAQLGLPPASGPLMPGERAAGERLKAFLDRIDAYDTQRDYPAVKGPSYLSTDLRFGTISIRALARAARERASAGAATWLGELVWRDFYFMILAEHPRVVDRAFRPEYDALVFDNDETLWRAWCEARTGYPIVDAAMRQILSSGYMHNRLRMIVASFLVKDLQIDWRHGERFFAAHLIDHDLAANNGGWQWSASTGCDAQPWFRIFNPVTQSQRFDPQGRFIRRYLPELARVPDRWIHAPWEMPPLEQVAAGCRIGQDYPAPVVDHARARELTLARFGRLRGRAPDATATD
jgi:deoxyribodipyrimidine photo-lyase